MASKNLYWFKLKNSYFNQLVQKKMKRQKNGKDMQTKINQIPGTPVIPPNSAKKIWTTTTKTHYANEN